MANYCIECKFAGKTSGSSVYCNKHLDWVEKYGSCNDYIWIKARSRFEFIQSWLFTLLHF